MTKHYCDRCKRELEKAWVYSGINATHINYELCERCSEELSKWISGEEVDIGVEERIKAQIRDVLLKNFNKWVRE